MVTQTPSNVKKKGKGKLIKIIQSDELESIEKHGTHLCFWRFEVPVRLKTQQISGLTLVALKKLLLEASKAGKVPYFKDNTQTNLAIEIECTLLNFGVEMEKRVVRLLDLPMMENRAQILNLSKEIYIKRSNYKDIEFNTLICDLSRDAKLMINIHIYCNTIKLLVGGGTTPLFDAQGYYKQSSHQVRFNFMKAAHPTKTNGEVKVNDLDPENRLIHAGHYKELDMELTSDIDFTFLDNGHSKINNQMAELNDNIKEFKLGNDSIIRMVNPFFESSLLPKFDKTKNWYKKTVLSDITLVIVLQTISLLPIIYHMKEDRSKITDFRTSFRKEIQKKKPKKKVRRKKRDKITGEIYSKDADAHIYIGNPNMTHTPTEKVYYDIIKKDDGEGIPSLEEVASMEDLMAKPIFFSICKHNSLSDFFMFWRYRYFMRQKHENSIVLVLINIFSNDIDKNELKELLKEDKNVSWNHTKDTNLLILLSAIFKDYPEIRRFAVKLLLQKNNYKETMNTYMMQLVTSLRYELKPVHSSLFIEMKTIALGDGAFASRLYWYLNVCESFKNEYSEIYKKMKDNLIHHLQSEQPGFSLAIAAQTLLYQKLIEFAIVAKKTSKVPKEMIEEFNENIFKCHTKNSLSIPLPIDPSHIAVKLDTEVKVMNSATKPVLYTFICVSKDDIKKDQKSQKRYSYQLFFKREDDLRQDEMVLQSIKYVDDCVTGIGGAQLIPYKAFSFTNSCGFVEAVFPSRCLESFSKRSQGIEEKLLEMTIEKANVENIDLNSKPGENWKTNTLKNMTDKFIRSLASYCVVSYVIGIGDRHRDNLLLYKDGQIFHIDFGYIFGLNPKPFSSQIKLTPDMYYIYEKNSQRKQLFENTVKSVYKTMNEEFDKLTLIFFMMKDCGMKQVDSNMSIELNSTKGNSKKTDGFSFVNKPNIFFLSRLNPDTSQSHNILSVIESCKSMVIEGGLDAAHTISKKLF